MCSTYTRTLYSNHLKVHFSMESSDAAAVVADEECTLLFLFFLFLLLLGSRCTWANPMQSVYQTWTACALCEYVGGVKCEWSVFLLLLFFFFSLASRHVEKCVTNLTAKSRTNARITSPKRENVKMQIDGTGWVNGIWTFTCICRSVMHGCTKRRNSECRVRANEWISFYMTVVNMNLQYI